MPWAATARVSVNRQCTHAIADTLGRGEPTPQCPRSCERQYLVLHTKYRDHRQGGGSESAYSAARHSSPAVVGPDLGQSPGRPRERRPIHAGA